VCFLEGRDDAIVALDPLGIEAFASRDYDLVEEELLVVLIIKSGFPHIRVFSFTYSALSS